MRLARYLAVVLVVAVILPVIERASALDDELRESQTFLGAESPPDKRALQYEQLIRSVLAEAFSDNVRTRMVALPTLRTEWVVGLRVGKRGEWEVFSLEPTISAKSYRERDEVRDELARKRALPVASTTEIRELEADLRDIERDLPEDPRRVPIERCVVPLSATVAERAQAVWIGVLRGATKSDAPALPYVRVIADGTSYHFWQHANPPFAASVSNPESGWASAKLAKLGIALRAYCQRPDRGTEQQMLSTVAEALPIR